MACQQWWSNCFHGNSVATTCTRRAVTRKAAWDLWQTIAMLEEVLWRPSDWRSSLVQVALRNPAPVSEALARHMAQLEAKVSAIEASTLSAGV